MDEIKENEGYRKESGLKSEFEQIDEIVPMKLMEENMKENNHELESTKQYLSIVLKELEEVRQEFAATKRAEQREKKRRNPWKFLSTLEFFLLLLLLCFIGVNYIKDKLNAAETFKQQAEGVNPTERPDNGQQAEEKVNVKIVEDLETSVAGIHKDSIHPFTASIESMYGYEYLCFSYQQLKIYYRNEFEKGSELSRQWIMIDNGSKRVEYLLNYDLSKDLTLLCPKYGEFSGDGNRHLVFLTYENGDTSKMPKELQMVETSSLWEYDAIDFETELKNLLSLSYKEGQGAEDTRMVITANSAEYIYQIPKETYIDAVYYEENPLQFTDHFTLNITSNAIEILAVAYLSEQEYLGQITANIGIDGMECTFQNVKYGAYVLANQEDTDSDGVIVPRTKPIGEYVTLWGNKKERFIIELSDVVELNPYNWENLVADQNGFKTYYEGREAVSIMGIDVSKYQGNIDWQKVKEFGVQYAMIRLGYRWINRDEGNLSLDDYFEQNIKGANEAGVAVGVYFFSQALNKAEAVEEAEMVLQYIKDYSVTYPVVFDTEEVISSNGYVARANDLTRQQRTDITKAFCEVIENAGYHPMIYANTKWMIMGIDLEQLTMYDKWFAYYSENITFPYKFHMLQYSDAGKVPGISSNVDLNISFVDYAK